MKFLTRLGLPLILLALCHPAWADDTFEEIDKQWEAEERAFDEAWQKEEDDFANAWEALEKAHQEEWARLEAEVKQKWQEFDHTTKKEWVAYSADRNARGKVDFEKGKLVFEAVVPDDDPEAFKKARQEIERQANRAFSKKDITGKGVLDDQILTKDREKVTSSNFGRYIRKELLPSISPQPEVFTSRDGTRRRRYTAYTEMVPGHVDIRARKYLPYVMENARRFHIQPQLVLAVMETESSFNPEAVSDCNAVGLMQIIPKWAGREAYRAIYGVDTAPSWGYLFKPENNIRLGCKYLSLLRYNHFKDVRGEVKNRYVTICGYNWGPTAMRRKVVNRYRLNSMADSQVYALLRRKTPEETRNYIKLVTERMQKYDATF